MSPLVAMAGAARDLVTRPDGLGVVVAAAHLALGLDGAGAIASVDAGAGVDDGAAAAAPRDLTPLVGVRVGFGFRSSIKDLLVELAGTPLGLLVDDLSGAPAPSGYGSIRERMVLGLPEPTLPAGAAAAVHQQTDVCAGWRTGGVPLRRRQAGEPLPFAAEPPAAPALVGADPLGWHQLPPLGPRQSRRARRLDLWMDGEALMLDAMFRDTTVDPDPQLTERVVHEYTVTATLDPETFTVMAIHADPRSLPFPTDCPAAAGSAALLLGEVASDFRTRVREVSRGPVSCTHLNDLFRSLADVSCLVAHLPSRT